MKKEIKIIGAGLSGLAAAINLAKAGYRVKVFEKNERVGKRFHGDYQGIENWVYDQDALEHIQDLNIELNFPYYPVKELNTIGPKGKLYNFKFNKNMFYLVRRGIERDTLDQSLYRQAKEAGVDILFNSSRDHRKFGDIVAQGYFPDRVIDAIVVGYNFQTSAPDQCWVIIDDSIAPDGYAYCLIANGGATLAVCIFRDYGKSKEHLSKAYQVFQKTIGFEVKDKKFFGGTTNSFLMKSAIFNGRLYAGESAGFIDALWGFGMKYALISGYLAAQSIITNENYDKLWRRTILSQLRASFVNRWYYKTLSNRSYQLLLERMKKSKYPIAFLRKITNFSFIHKISIPFAFLSLREKGIDRRKF